MGVGVVESESCRLGCLVSLPHPNPPEGGMLFPKFHIEEVKGQEARVLTRFDLDYDLPDHLLPEFPSVATQNRPVVDT